MRKRLEETEARYRALIIASAQVLYRMSPDWTEVRQLQGGDLVADSKEPRRDWLRDYIYRDDQRRVTMAIEQALSAGSVFELEHRFARADGTPGWVFSRAVPVRNSAGEIVEWFGAASDITARKCAEEQLRISEEKYRTLFANMTEGFGLGEAVYGSEGKPCDIRFLEVNDAFYEQTGLPRGIEGGPLRGERLPQLEQVWIDCFCAVAVGGKADRIESSNTYTGRYYDVYVFSPHAGQFAILFRDITEQRGTREALEQSEKRLALALKAGGTSVWELDVAKGLIRSIDYGLFAMLGYPRRDEITVAEAASRIHEQDRDAARASIDELICGKRDSHGTELRVLAPDSSWRWILSQAVAAARDASGRATRLVGTNTDITAREEADDRVHAAARHDPLTGLPNRSLIFEYASHILATARRNRTRGTFLFVDLDRFKPVNDLYGHEIGDRLLQEAANRLAGCVRAEDLVGRLGGDEFIVVMQHEEGALRAAAVAQHVIEALSQPFEINTLDLAISASVGISHYPEHGTDVDTLIRAADLAMYQTKYERGGKYFVFHPELETRAEQASAIEARLKRALQRKDLTLHYQPVIDIRTQEVVGAEALLRLHTEDGTAVPPGTFIPIAESAGLIGPLGEWVAAEACRQHEEWRRLGLPSVSIAINVSPLQFRQYGFAERLQEIVRNSGIDPAGIQIEVIESTVMGNVEDAVRTLNGIRAGGIRISLDDFGTGHSSLSHLSSLPLDKLKVDQSFVRCLGRQKMRRAITEAIIALGRTLNLQVVGEGIDSEQTLAYLRQHGCDQAQGYFISRPLPAREFARWFHEWDGAALAA